MQHKNLAKSSNDEQSSYLAAFHNFEHKIENMFNQFWHNPFRHDEKPASTWPLSFEGMPKMNIIDREKELLVKAELPGINKEDLEVSISNNQLFIKAKTIHEEKEEKGDYLRKEITSNEYYRSIHLPVNVDDGNIKSDFKNGILQLTLPKKEDSHRKRIDIK